MTKRKTIQVSIPAGIDNGQSIRIRGKGEPGRNGGERGDLLVEVIVSQHPIFKRQDMDVYSTVPISFAKAALGGSIRIATVDGQVEYEVKPGTPDRYRVRLRARESPVCAIRTCGRSLCEPGGSGAHHHERRAERSAAPF